jgi:hypothetical protein
MCVRNIFGEVGGGFAFAFLVGVGEEGEGKEVGERCVEDGCVVLEG